MRTINLTAQQIKRITIAIAGIILAIAAIWYACEISTFSSLSESDAKWWVHTSELLLLGSAVVLTIGLFGEWPDSESWKTRLLYKVAKAAVIVGMLGELLGDGGVFVAGDRLQELEGKAISAANERAGEANERAGKAQERAAKAELELAKIQLPRHFQASSNFDAVGRKYLSGKKFDLSANPDFEPMTVALEVRRGLAAIGMTEVSSRAANHWTPPNGGMPIGTVIRPGIAVRACDNTLAEPNKPNSVRILGSLLADSGLGTKDSPVFSEPADKDDCDIDRDVLHVEIGSKILTPWKPPQGDTVVYPSLQLEVPK